MRDRTREKLNGLSIPGSGLRPTLEKIHFPRTLDRDKRKLLPKRTKQSCRHLHGH